MCCPNCDTRNKIRNFVEGEYSLELIQSLITLKKLNLLVTGGETTFNKNLDYTKILLNQTTCEYKYVETNGYDLLTLYEYCKHNNNIKYIYSPKIFDNKDLRSEKSRTEVFLKTMRTGDLIIKLVYNKFSISYIEELYRFTGQIGIYTVDIPSCPAIYIMPEGKTKEEVLLSAKEAFKFANDYGLNITTRLHLIHDFC